MDKECSSICGSYELYKMIVSGKTYCYSGDIPCLRCSRFSYLKDNFNSIGASENIVYTKKVKDE